MIQSQGSSLAELQTLVADLKRQVQALQSTVQSLQPSPRPAVDEEPAGADRRHVLKLAVAGLGGLGLAAAGGAAPADAAAINDPMVAGGQADGDQTTTLLAVSGGAGFGDGVLAVTDTVFADFDPAFPSHAAVTAYGASLVDHGVAGFGSVAGVLGRSGGAGVAGAGAGTNGRGGVFSAHAAAQVQLVPWPRSSHPAAVKRGDLYADKTGRLWFCKKGGTTATWHQIA